MIAICNEKSRDIDIPVHEHGRTFRLLNPSRKWINKVAVDTCYITTGLRCDYLFEVEQQKVYYVELKGKNIEHAVKQLRTTMNYCKSEHATCPKECHIVASRVPKMSTSIQKSKKEFKQKYAAALYVHTKEKIITV